MRRTQRVTEETEEETQEHAVVGAREVTTEDDVSDWGFDDDPADYSAAV